jgi:hypothetical protein
MLRRAAMSVSGLLCHAGPGRHRRVRLDRDNTAMVHQHDRPLYQGRADAIEPARGTNGEHDSSQLHL